jgi:hypothetical protein
MKKTLLLILTSILLVSVMGFALAANEDAPGNANPEVEAIATPTLYGEEAQSGEGQGMQVQGANASGNATQNQGEMPGLYGEGNQTQEMRQERTFLSEGEYKGPEGKTFKIQEGEFGNQELESNGVKAQVQMDLTNKGEENGPVMMEASLSNGKNAEVKVMPDTASEKALERLKLKNCVEEQGCLLELREVRDKEDSKVVYQLKAQKESKVLGLFKKKMPVQAQVDAETGEVIQVKKPWWAFLASESQE